MRRYFNPRRNSTNAQTADSTPTASAVAVALQPTAPLTPTRKTLPENTANNETKPWCQIDLRVTPCTLCPCGHRRNPMRISGVETTSLHSVQMNRRSSFAIDNSLTNRGQLSQRTRYAGRVEHPRAPIYGQSGFLGASGNSNILQRAILQ
jgi:hypothetical protein